MTKYKEIDDIAKAIAKDIMKLGDEPNSPAIRLQFMGGKYPDNEKPQGGLCESALAAHIAVSLYNSPIAEL